MIRYSFNPLASIISEGEVRFPSEGDFTPHQSAIVEVLTLAYALGENLDIQENKIIVFDKGTEELIELNSIMVSVDLDYNIDVDGNPFIKKMNIDSSVTRKVESFDKPYAVAGRLYGLLSPSGNNDYKKDSDDFIKLEFTTGEQNYQFVTSNVNSTLTESYKPLSAYQSGGTYSGSTLRFYDLEDLAVDSMASTQTNALQKNIAKKPMISSKIIKAVAPSELTQLKRF